MKRMGSRMDVVQKTINYINENYPEIFTIADAKRGDIDHPQCTKLF
jgi:orotidine-5'-phosphate decarboxylase